jgi:hypothetical protein
MIHAYVLIMVKTKLTLSEQTKKGASAWLTPLIVGLIKHEPSFGF